jgi:hypothetical protein
VHAQDDDVRGRRGGNDLPRGFNAIQLGHADIEHGDIGVVLCHEFDGLTALVGFGHDFKIGLLFQKKFDAGADDRVVVGEQDTDLCQGRSLDGRIPQWAVSQLAQCPKIR